MGGRTFTYKLKRETGKKVKELDREHMCITHRPRKQCGDGQREGHWGPSGGGQRGGGNGDIYNNVNNKNKVLKKERNRKNYIKYLPDNKTSQDLVKIKG